MRSRYVAFAWLCGLACLPAAVASQEPRLVGKLPDAQRAQVDGMLNSARAAALPTEPMVDLALEGHAKGAPPDLIVRAVNRLRDELRQAREAFGVSASGAEVTAGASALRAGATRENLVRLRGLRSGSGHGLIVAAGTLADLVARGVPADTGIAAVLALASNASDADYIAFRRNVERDIALGASPAASIGARLRAVGELADFPSLQSASGTGSATGPKKKKP
jgi:hypothetical protein